MPGSVPEIRPAYGNFSYGMYGMYGMHGAY